MSRRAIGRWTDKEMREAMAKARVEGMREALEAVKQAAPAIVAEDGYTSTRIARHKQDCTAIRRLITATEREDKKEEIDNG